MLINPLHAAEPSGRMEPSPYLPTTRRFQNPIYLRVERIPEYADLSAADRATVASLRAALQQDLVGLDAIDRDTAWVAKTQGAAAGARRAALGRPGDRLRARTGPGRPRGWTTTPPGAP